MKHLTDHSSYHIRHSAKAKHLQLRVTSAGLEVVVPIKKRISVREIDGFVFEKKNWIQKKLLQMAAFKNLQEEVTLPSSIHLQAINQRWQVFYVAMERKHLKIIENPAMQLTVLGPIVDEKRCILSLRTWLKTVAEHYLSERLVFLSQRTGLSFQQVSIRNNRTRWGSCTSSGHIRLSCQLLFLPPQLVDHVLLHELCHTRFMNHGKSFWKLLARCDEFFSMHVEQLKKARGWVPDWI